MRGLHLLGLEEGVGRVWGGCGEGVGRVWGGCWEA